jgi:hypothetical protein
MNKDHLLLAEAYTSIYENQEESYAIADQIRNLLAKGAAFTSFIYKTQGSANKKKGEAPNGPTKIYKVNLGISYGNIKNHNLSVIQGYQPRDDWQEIAKQELIDSLSKPYVPKTQDEQEQGEGTFVNLGKGIRYNKTYGYLNILGQVTGKAEEVAPGVQKERKPADYLAVNKDGSPRGGDVAHIARAKRMIEHELRNYLRGGLTSYDIDVNKIAGVRLANGILTFEPVNGQEAQPMNFLKNAPAPKKQEVAPEQAAPQVEEPQI